MSSSRIKPSFAAAATRRKRERQARCVAKQIACRNSPIAPRSHASVGRPFPGQLWKDGFPGSRSACAVAVAVALGLRPAIPAISASDFRGWRGRLLPDAMLACDTHLADDSENVHPSRAASAPIVTTVCSTKRSTPNERAGDVPGTAVPGFVVRADIESGRVRYFFASSTSYTISFSVSLSYRYSSPSGSSGSLIRLASMMSFMNSLWLRGA